MPLEIIGAGIGGLLLGGTAIYVALKNKVAAAITEAQANSKAELATLREQLQQEAKVKAEALASTAIGAAEVTLAHERKRVDQLTAQLKIDEADLKQRLDTLGKREKQITDRELALQEKATVCDRRETKLLQREEDMEASASRLDDQHAKVVAQQQDLALRLEAIAGLNREQAKQLLLSRLDEELTAEQNQIISKRKTALEVRSKEVANELISRAIQRYAAEHTVETTTARVPIKDDDMKGRIIGKEGRNIRAFEMATGVDLIIDDTPGLITVSCFDGIRREIACRTLRELLEDGRIHPARIEEVLARTQQDIDQEVLKMGEDAAYAVDVSGLHPKILKLLGKLNFRTSYGQNNLQHTQEVAFLCGAMAADLGLDPKLGRRCGLLHDIGKALDHEQEGSHPELGAEALRRYGENEIVQNAALAHHEGHEVTSIYTVLTAAADAISAARPGARRENSERFIKRMEQLEDIACTFEGVAKAYAIQAGRELRVIVNGHRLGDDSLSKTARQIARRIEDEVAYPGEVKVTLIRETRSTATAR